MGKPGAGKGSQGRRPKGDAAKHKGKGSGGLPIPEVSLLDWAAQSKCHVVTLSLPCLVLVQISSAGFLTMCWQSLLI